MNEVIEAFHRLIPARHRTNGRGWISFNCPSCNDKRNRFNFLTTPAGGFRAKCFNGGCEFERRTGWEPTDAFVGRRVKLFELMGGDRSDIPLKYFSAFLSLSNPELADYWMSDHTVGPGSKSNKNRVAIHFDEVALPEACVLLWQAADKDAEDVRRYVLSRSVCFKMYHFLWTPKFKRHVIIPFINDNRIIGWIGRKIDPGKDFAHIKCPNFPTDYMFNQHMRYRFQTVLVMEGTFDALALDAFGTFGNVISATQVNLLNHLKDSGRRVALLPDYKKNEWRSYWATAKENRWYLCIPEWPGDDGYSRNNYIKDPGDSIKRNGLLHTLEVMMQEQSFTTNYEKAEQLLSLYSRY